jgi:hypothetical protein
LDARAVITDAASWGPSDPSGIPWLLRAFIGSALFLLALLLCTPVRRCEMEAEADLDAEDEFFGKGRDPDARQ